MIKKIILGGREIEYTLTRKNVKNINLRIKPDMSVSVSASVRVPLSVIEAFLVSKSETILRVLENYGRCAVPERKYESGETVTVFGRELTFRVCSGKAGAAIEGDTLILSVRDTESKEERRETFEGYLREVCREVITDLCVRAYPEFERRGVLFPEICFRKMSSRWGSCVPSKNKITFSYALTETSLAFAEYVVAHEFTHLLVPNHSARFYALLSEVMPDHAERRRMRENNA